MKVKRRDPPPPSADSLEDYEAEWHVWIFDPVKLQVLVEEKVSRSKPPCAPEPPPYWAHWFLLRSEQPCVASWPRRTTRTKKLSGRINDPYSESIKEDNQDSFSEGDEAALLYFNGAKLTYSRFSFFIIINSTECSFNEETVWPSLAQFGTPSRL